ncbi:hypothetical protein EKO04_011578 [Ascochyta lentis]|uniref:Uncharacterized protein n=1 Tax=Ascochyta lentis TaxID=205686 RepID=A0A8H7ITJ6_9PLEO|nr:hypothetical protein EKO04_011578 [Ascochyta lentis]
MHPTREQSTQRPHRTQVLSTQAQLPPGTQQLTLPPRPPQQQITAAGAEAPRDELAQATKYSVAPVVPGPMRPIVPPTMPFELPERGESNLFADGNHQHLHYSPSGVLTYPRGQPVDHKSSRPDSKDNVVMQTERAAEQERAEAGDRHSQPSEAIAPPALERQNPTVSLSLDVPASGGAPRLPTSRLARCSVLGRGRSRKPGPSRADAASPGPSAAGKSVVDSQASETKAVCNPTTSNLEYQKPHLTSAPQEKVLTSPESSHLDNQDRAGKELFQGPSGAGTSLQRASNAPKVAAHTTTSTSESSSSNSLGNLQTSALLAPPPDTARAHSRTSDRLDSNANIVDKLYQQLEQPVGQVFLDSVDNPMPGGKRVVNLCNDESGTGSANVQVSYPSNKDIPAKEVKAGESAALDVGSSETEHFQSMRGRQKEADPDYHPPSNESSDEDTDSTPLMLVYKTRQVLLSQKSSSTTPNGMSAEPLSKKRKTPARSRQGCVSDVVPTKRSKPNAAPIEACSCTRGSTVKQKAPTSARSPSVAATAKADMAALPKTRKSTRSTRGKAPNRPAAVDQEAAHTGDSSMQQQPLNISDVAETSNGCHDNNETEDDEMLIRLKLEAVELRIQLAEMRKRKATI